MERYRGWSVGRQAAFGGILAQTDLTAWEMRLTSHGGLRTGRRRHLGEPGMLEGSNVSPTEGVVQLITVQRNTEMLRAH